MKIDKKTLIELIEGFERVEDISDIIIIGENEGVRRIKFGEFKFE